MNSVWLLQSFLQEDSIIIARPLLENKDIAVFVHSWKYITVSWNPPKEIEFVPESRKDAWSLLWSFSEWSLEDMVVVTGMSDIDLLVLFDRCKMLRLIYPNGTIAPSAHRLLELEVGEQLAKMMGAMDQASQRKEALERSRETKQIEEKKEKFEGEV